MPQPANSFLFYLTDPLSCEGKFVAYFLKRQSGLTIKTKVKDNNISLSFSKCGKCTSHLRLQGVGNQNRVWRFFTIIFQNIQQSSFLALCKRCIHRFMATM